MGKDVEPVKNGSLKESPKQSPLPLRSEANHGALRNGGLLRRIWKAPLLSPEGLLVRAVAIAVLYGMSELFGLREYTTFISGTSANTGISPQTAAVLGLIHLFLYVGFILVTPVLVIAAGLLSVWQSHRKA
jgi:hypothetical protein